MHLVHVKIDEIILQNITDAGLFSEFRNTAKPLKRTAVIVQARNNSTT